MARWTGFRHRPESAIEADACQRARDDGWLVMKAGENGWPDRVFLKDGVTVWIEFKTAVGKVRHIQRHRHLQIDEHGGTVFTCRTAEAAMSALRQAHDRAMYARRLAKAAIGV